MGIGAVRTVVRRPARVQPTLDAGQRDSEYGGKLRGDLTGLPRQRNTLETGLAAHHAILGDDLFGRLATGQQGQHIHGKLHIATPAHLPGLIGAPAGLVVDEAHGAPVGATVDAIDTTVETHEALAHQQLEQSSRSAVVGEHPRH